MKLEFETIYHNEDHDIHDFIKRAKVIGGWIVCEKIISADNKVSSNMFFLADPTHEWNFDE